MSEGFGTQPSQASQPAVPAWARPRPPAQYRKDASEEFKKKAEVTTTQPEVTTSQPTLAPPLQKPPRIASPPPNIMTAQVNYHAGGHPPPANNNRGSYNNSSQLDGQSTKKWPEEGDIPLETIRDFHINKTKKGKVRKIKKKCK